MVPPCKHLTSFLSEQKKLTPPNNIFNTAIVLEWLISGNRKLKCLDLLTCSNVAVNLRLLVYRYGMKNSGTEEKWNTMFQRYKDTSLAQEKDKLLYGLASVENVTLLHK